MKKILTVLFIGIVLGIVLMILLNRFYPLGNIFRSSGDSLSGNESNNSFYAVTNKLDKGGDYYAYFNTERVNSLIQNLIAGAKDVVTKTGKLNSGITKNAENSISFINTIFDKLGIFSINGIGLSSLKKGNDIYKSKFVINCSSKDGLIWNILGKSPSKMEYLNLLPRDTVFATFSNIDFSFFRDWIYDLAKSSGIDDFEKGLKKIEPSLEKSGVNLKKIFDSIDGYSGTVITFDKKSIKKISKGGKSISIPDPGFMLIFHVKNSYIFDLIEKIYPGVEKFEKDGIKKLILKGMPKLPITFDPQIVLKDNILFLSSNSNLSKSILDSMSGKRQTWNSEELKHLSQNMPKYANSFTFLSKNFFKTFLTIYKSFGNKKNPAFDFMKKIGFDLGNISVFKVTEISDEGMVITSNSTLKPETSLFLPVIVSIGGALSAVAIPNLIKATEKSKQKKSMMDMKFIGNAIEFYIEDQQKLPEVYSIEELEKLLVPNYMTNFPKYDGWGNPFLYKYDKESKSYFIGCSGKNGIFDSWTQSGVYKINYSLDYFKDIIFSNGKFIYYPEQK